MEKELTQLLRKTFSSKKERLEHLIDRTSTVLKEERSRTGGGTVMLNPDDKLIVVGDLHGSFTSLNDILSSSRFLRRMGLKEKVTLVFLGDYGDRGQDSPEVYSVLLWLKQKFPTNVILLRGNHEGLPLVPFTPHDMPKQLEQKYNENWNGLYTKLLDLFSDFPHALIVEEKYLLLHGGAPHACGSVEDINQADKLFPMTTCFEEILWNDPLDDLTGVKPSPRGLGNLFGEDVTSRILELTRTKTLIRSHEPCEGVKVNHSGKVLTVFSRNGAPYTNTAKAYLEIDLSLEPKNAQTLAQEAILC
jgi:protein phosphatase